MQENVAKNAEIAAIKGEIKEQPSKNKEYKSEMGKLNTGIDLQIQSSG